jgi:exodeoxyribonuclease-5
MISYATLSSDQQQVFDAMTAFSRGEEVSERPGILRVGGYAGTGKTATLGVFAKAACKTKLLVAYVAFTGRAASVLARSLKAAGVPFTQRTRKSDEDSDDLLAHVAAAQLFDMSLTDETSGPAFCGTIHRLIYRPSINDEEELLGWNKREVLDRRYDLIVVDEASMVSDEMLIDLEQFGVPILAVGDHGQLPPVMVSGALMQDPDLRLEKIHRQAEGNPVIALSRHVRDGGRLALFKTSDPRVAFRYRRDVQGVLATAYRDAGHVLDVGTLCWTNKMRIKLNSFARTAIGRKGAPQAGEVLICLKNDRPVYNGMRGVLQNDAQFWRRPWQMNVTLDYPEEELQDDNRIICAAQFNRERPFGTLDELRERGIRVDKMSEAGSLFDFGYALTAHKSQGSQFEHAIVYLDRPEIPQQEDYRRWVYTAITRAREKLTVLR